MADPLLDGPVEDRVAAIAGLAERVTPPSDTELASLVRCLAERRKVVQRRAAEACAALAVRRIEIVPRLARVLAVADVRQRWGAVYALSLIGPLPAAALPTLLEAIGLDDGDLRWAAADLLKQCAANRRAAVVAPLIEAAGTPGPRRKMALYCLRDLAATEALAVADAALGDPAIDVRLAALSAIAALDPDRAHAAGRVAALIGDGDPRLQRAAAGTLGTLGVSSPPVLGALARAEASGDASLRRAASQARRRLG
jgi:hypothetical protein